MRYRVPTALLLLAELLLGVVLAAALVTGVSAVLVQAILADDTLRSTLVSIGVATIGAGALSILGLWLLETEIAARDRDRELLERIGPIVPDEPRFAPGFDWLAHDVWDGAR